MPGLPIRSLVHLLSKVQSCLLTGSYPLDLVVYLALSALCRGRDAARHIGFWADPAQLGYSLDAPRYLSATRPRTPAVQVKPVLGHDFRRFVPTVMYSVGNV